MGKHRFFQTWTFLRRWSLWGSLFIIQGAYAGRARTAEQSVQFLPSSQNPVNVKVEVPVTPDEFEHGLMFRTSLAKDHGMLFVFDKPRPLFFWMHNTYISLDMIFLDEHGRVIWIEEKAPPLDDTPRGSTLPAQYVVEVVGGFARAHGIKIGTSAKLINIPQLHAESPTVKGSLLP